MNEGASSKSSNGLVWLLAVCCFILGSAQQYLLGVPDQIASDTGVSLSAISLLMTAYALVNALLAPVAIMVTAKWSQRKQLIGGMVLIVAGLALMGLTNNFGLLIFSRGLVGLGNGVFVVTAYALAQSLAAPGKQASAMADVALGFSASSVLAMPIARALRDIISWHSAYLVLAVLGVVGIVAVMRLIPEIKSANASSSAKDRLAPLANKAVVSALAGSLFVFMAFSVFYTYITPFIDTAMPDLGSGTSVVLFGLGIMSLIGTKLCGVIADRFSPRTAIEFCLVSIALMLAATFALEGAGYGVIPPLLLWMGAAWMFVPVQNVVLTDLAGEGSAMALSLSNSFMQMGNALGAPIAGAVIAVAPVMVLPLVAVPFILAAFGFEEFAFRKGQLPRRSGKRA